MYLFLSLNIFSPVTFNPEQLLSPFYFYDIKYTVTSKKKKGFLMEKYQMSRGNRRPASCGMPNSVPYMTPISYENPSCNTHGNCNMNVSTKTGENHSSDSSCHRKTCFSMYKHLDHLPVAMAYVPFQKFTTTFDICYALKVGTIFPDLCKPFCGKRGGMR